jgi:hypothetical protein
MTKRQEYLDFKKRQEKEFEEFPIAYAFNDKQLEEALEKLGAAKEECVSVFGHGDIVRRENVTDLMELLDRHDREMKRQLIKDPEFAEAALYTFDSSEQKWNVKNIKNPNQE